MSYLMSGNLKKVLAIGMVSVVAACLIPGEAEAGIANGSGFPRFGNGAFQFQLDTSISDKNPRRRIGYFPGAFKNFNFTNNVNGNVDVCGENVCPPGDMTITRFQTDFQGNVPGLPFGLHTLRSDGFLPNFNFSNALRADITFDSIIPQLIFFIQPTNCDIINNLSCFNQLNQNQIKGIIFPDSALSSAGVIDTLIISPQISRQRPAQRISAQSAIDELTVSQQVPEPTATGSLVGIGFLGALSLLKRHKRLQKSV